MKQQRRYLAYLLRVWRESGGELPDSDLPGGDLPHGDPPLWRASLESPQSAERRGFADLDELFAFLRERTGIASPEDVPEEGEGRPQTVSELEED
jgi:hypothetical protein